MRRNHIIILCVACASILIMTAGAALAAGTVTLNIEPSHLDVDTFFTGGQVTISGQVPIADDVVIEITGPMVDSQYDIKGRVGPFWMNRQKVHLENTPGLYALLIPAGDDWADRLPALNLGFEKLKSAIHVSESELSKQEILQMFMNLKESEGLYGQKFGGVTYDNAKDGWKTFHAVFDFPSSTFTGNYLIEAVVVKNGMREGDYVDKLEVREIGFVKLIDNLASNQRLVYGVMAVVIALFTGAIMGFLFKGGGGH